MKLLIRHRDYLRCSCGKKFIVDRAVTLEGARMLAVLHVIAAHAWYADEAPQIIKEHLHV